MSEALDIIAFGPFQIDTNRRQLSRAGAPIPLSSRAFDILVLLVENRSRVVTKVEIMRVVWRGMIVDENNLAVHISALRRALSKGADEASSANRRCGRQPGCADADGSGIIEGADPRLSDGHGGDHAG